MNLWKLQDAKARFSEFLEQALTGGPQVVTRRGIQEAVLVPIEEWKRLQSAAPANLKDVLLATSPRFDLPELPHKLKRRNRVEFQ
jgi:prevent-host-death family protein